MTVHFFIRRFQHIFDIKIAVSKFYPISDMDICRRQIPLHLSKFLLHRILQEIFYDYDKFVSAGSKDQVFSEIFFQNPRDADKTILTPRKNAA